MDDTRIGWSLRVLRRRRRWTQAQLGERVGVSQSLVSLVERGHLDALSLRSVRALFRALDAEFASTVRWRSGAIDRLLDERHAALVEAAVALLRHLGWQTAVELSFSVYGERGSIDVLAYHRGAAVALVIEVKSELQDVEETLRRLDVKVRHAPELARRQFDARPAVVGRLLVLPKTTTSWRRISSHEATFGSVLPARSTEVRRWLAEPGRPLAGILLVAGTTAGGSRCARSRTSDGPAARVARDPFPPSTRAAVCHRPRARDHPRS